MTVSNTANLPSTPPPLKKKKKEKKKPHSLLKTHADSNEH